MSQIPQGYPPQFPSPNMSHTPLYPYIYPPQAFPSPQGYPSSNSSRRSSVDGPSTNKDGWTQGLDNINLVVDPSSDEEDISIKGKNKKVPYSTFECEVLAQCYIDISVDSIIGNDQKLAQMWKRVCKVYNQNRPTNTPERHWTSLKTHFYKLQKQVRGFSDCYNSIAKTWGSGKSDVDIVEKAHLEYRERCAPTGFKHIGVWRILNSCPKFQQVDGEVQSKKKTKNSEDGAYTSSNPDSSVNDEVTTRLNRPIGQKAAKRNAKGKNKTNEYENMKESIDDKNARLLRIARAKEYKIVMKDTSSMSPEQLHFHQMMVESIKKNWSNDN